MFGKGAHDSVRHSRGRLLAWYAAWTLFSACGCGPRSPADGAHAESRENDKVHRIPGDTVELLTEPGRPSLQLVRREGDPRGAAAVAVYPPGGTAGSLQIASLMRTRLLARGLRHELEANGLGFLLVRDVSEPKMVRDWFGAVYGALHDPVSPKDLERLKRLPLLEAAAKRSDALSPFGLCMGELGAEGIAPLTEALENRRNPSYGKFLEQLRVDTAEASRVGFSTLGTSELIEAAQSAETGDWIAGEPLDDSWSSDPERAVVRSRGARELRIALRVADGESALAGARALQDPTHPFHARLHALDPRLEASDIRVTLRPAGACVGLSVAFDSSSQLPLSRIAAASVLAQDELRHAVQPGFTDDEQTLAILSPQGAREAAALAAWTAVQSPRTGGKAKVILEYRGSESPAITHQALDKALQKTEAEWAGRTLPLVVRDETGQAEIWALLGSPCGTLPEPAEEAGLRALTVAALAQDWGRAHGVQLEPWISPTGIGLLAHGPSLRGESVAGHGERIGRALGSAFHGAPLDGRTLAAVRADLLDRLGDDPGLEIVRAILGAGRPSLASPLGTSKTMATFSVADAERTRADLAQEPLRLAILTNSAPAQATAAASALQDWLAPTRDHVAECPKVREDAPPPGTWSLETVDENVSTNAFVAVFAPASTSVGRATEYLLNRRGGYLDRAFSDPGLVARAEAHFLGGPLFGGLFLQVVADEGQLGPATHQARAVLRAMAREGIPEEDIREAQKVHRAIEEENQRTQRGRLIRLFEMTRADLPSAPADLSEAALRQFHESLDEPHHRVVTVVRRK